MRVYLEPYDPAWPDRFAAEAGALRALIGDFATGGIHHVGSTSVPGLAAKPIIDIMIGVNDLSGSRPCIELLGHLRYVYAPYRTDVMHWFCKPDPARRTHHLHLVPTGYKRFTDVLAFRDLLRSSPEAAAEYESLKRDLARRFPHDREAYTDGKGELISRLVRTAGH
jgi:GrpB-like predicted nucleotidyltransferase (UPF0157 family)